MEGPQGVKTKAYVVSKPEEPFVLQDVVLDGVGPHELLVEIQYTGLCHTDIVAQHGLMPIGGFPAVLGHEGVGIVRHVGSGVGNKDIKPGDTVLLSFRACQTCRKCKAGQHGGCLGLTRMNFTETARPGAKDSPISLPDGTQVFGQFFGQSSLSKMAVVAEHSAVKIDARPEELGFLAPLACGYLTGAGTVMNAMQPRKGDTMAVLGMGAVGMAAMFAARALGVETIIAVDIFDEKIQKASALGASHTINSKTQPDLVKGIKAICPDGVDYILDATGVAALLSASVEALAHGGLLTLVGVPPPNANVQFNAMDVLTSCKRIMGVIEGFADSQKVGDCSTIQGAVDWQQR